MERIFRLPTIICMICAAIICIVWNSGCDEEKPISPPVVKIPQPLTPPNGEQGTSKNPVLTWASASNVVSYRLQVSLVETFENTIVDASNISGTSYNLVNLPPAATCFWRVQAQLIDGLSDWSPIWSFRTIVIDMVLIPAGTYQMGNLTNTIHGDSCEKPVHSVTLTRSFLIGKYEITQAEFEAVMGYNPSSNKGDTLPVEMVRWCDAVRFCNRLSILDGFDTCYTGSMNNTICNFNANGYRLPTEAEWEYACRAGTTTDFYTGNITNPNCSPLDQNLDLAGWYCGNANGISHPVGLKTPNARGVYDMHGNVMEWCWDWWEGHCFTTTPVTDPTGPSTGTHRIIRGGSWTHHARQCRSSYRFSRYYPNQYSSYIGFRVVRNVQQ